MTIRIGVYDFFSYLIGGGFLLGAILYVVQKFLPVSSSLLNLSTPQFLILGTIAYVMGFVSKPISSRWYGLWVPKDLYQKTVNGLKAENPRLRVDIKDMDWYTLVAFIKRNNLDMALEVEQYNAKSIMLRSVSLGFLIFSSILGLEFVLPGRWLGHLILSLICFLLSIILIKQSIIYHTYFFRSIYQSVVATIIEPDQLSVTIDRKK